MNLHMIFKFITRCQLQDSAILHDLTKVYYLRALPSLKEHHHGKKNIHIQTYLYKVATE